MLAATDVVCLPNLIQTSHHNAMAQAQYLPFTDVEMEPWRV